MMDAEKQVYATWNTYMTMSDGGKDSSFLKFHEALIHYVWISTPSTLLRHVWAYVEDGTTKDASFGGNFYGACLFGKKLV